jgi:hypothetical protein
MMKLQEEITDYSKSKIQQWRAVMDELEVQLALGKAEAKDMIEQERKNLSAYIEKQKAQLNAEEKAAHKEQLVFKTQLEDLYTALDADLAKSKRSYDRNKKAILHAIHVLEAQIKEKAEILEKWFDRDLESMKDSLDDYRIKLALSTYESVEELTEPCKELQADMQQLIDKITKMVYTGDSKVTHFIEEISESLEHLKRAFTDILN